MNIFSTKDINCFRFAIPATVFAFAALTSSCEDETSKIGSSLTEGEISISIDTMMFNLNAVPLENTNFDSRTGNLLLGNINVPEYGKLDCSFVTRLLCATNLNLADSLLTPERVDSCDIMMYIKRGDLVGDSLAPQKVSVFGLDKQLPSDISNTFNPEGYYNKSNPLGSASYTPTWIGENDSIFSAATNTQKYYYTSIQVPLSPEIGKQIFSDYKDNPSIFAWPETFAQKYPGYFIDQTFGNGCVANIFEIRLRIFYWYMKKVSYTEDKETKYKWEKTAAYAIPFISSPEVLSSNNISYTVSDDIIGMINDGKTIITTPGGYNTSFRFPAQDIINHYKKDEHNLSLISELLLTIPAEPIENSFNIGTAPTLLLIKSSEVEDFFNNNKIPDNVSSFTASYDATNKQYKFSSMRSYIMQLLDKSEITDEDVEFTIIPVELQSETAGNYGSSTSYVTKCSPYIVKPTMTHLFTEKASIVLTFSSQIIK